MRAHLDRITKKLADASFATKINLLTWPALVAIVVFSLVLVAQNIAQIRDADIATKDARIASIMDNVAHNFAVERGLTAGYLGSQGANGRSKLDEQRAVADQAKEDFLELYSELERTASLKLKANLNAVKTSLEKVPSVRDKVNQLAPDSQAFQTYSEINKQAISLIELVSLELSNAELISEFNALINVLWLKERAGQERGLLNGVFSRGTYTAQQVAQSFAYKSEQSSRLESLGRLLPTVFAPNYEQINNSSAANQLNDLRRQFTDAVDQGEKVEVSASQWFGLATARIKDIKALSNELISDIREKTEALHGVAMSALFIESVIALGVLVLIIVLSLIIKKQLSSSIQSMSQGFEQIKANKDFSYRIDIESNDELGEAVRSFNSLMAQLESVFSQVNESIQAMARGDFNQKVELELDGDLLLLKEGVNQSIDKVKFTMSELENVMTALEQGDFQVRMSKQIEGDLRIKVDHAMNILSDAMNEVSSVVVSMSQGDFSSRVTLPLNGSLASLKDSVNGSAEIVEGAINEISRVISTQSEGDFSVRVEGEYEGQLDVLKQTINDSIIGIESAVGDINQVFDSLSKGDFTIRVESELNGELNTMKQRINSTLQQVSAAVTEILEVTRGQACGQLDKQVNGNYLGQLDLLKQSVNSAGDTIRSVVDAISGSMAMMNNGDFSSQIDAPMEGRFSDLKNDFNRSMSALKEVISEIKNVSQAQSRGDLSMRVQDSYRGELNDIAISINKSLESVASIVSQIKTSGSTTLTMAQEQSRAAQSISKRTESQASSLQQIAATTEELSTSVHQTSKDLDGMEAQIGKVKAASHSCQQSIQLTVEKMDRIRESSGSMETFTNLIDEISFQTNLLALNAAVESARAGSHGKGFGVVAAEVRNLAQRSAQAAKEIKVLISENNNIVDQGFESINSSSAQIESISKAIEQTDELARNINNACAEQARGLSEVNEAITQLDSDTQHNSALVENTSESARSVEEQVFQVNESLKFFSAANQLQPVLEEKIV